MATQPEHKPNGHPPMADDQASAGRIPAGEATLVALPNSLTKPFLLNPLQALVPLGNGFFTF
jgi:hypothetical protein